MLLVHVYMQLYACIMVYNCTPVSAHSVTFLSCHAHQEHVPMGSSQLSEQLVHAKTDLEEVEEKRSKVIAEMRALEDEIKHINVEVTKQVCSQIYTL